MKNLDKEQIIEINDFVDQYKKQTLSVSRQFKKIRSYYFSDYETIWQMQNRIGFEQLVNILSAKFNN